MAGEKKKNEREQTIQRPLRGSLMKAELTNNKLSCGKKINGG